MNLFNKNDKTDPIMRAVKAVNSVAEGEKSLSPEDLERQRNAQDLLAKLIIPPIGMTQTEFNIGDMNAAVCKPDFAHYENRIILYCHGGGYTCGSLKYAGILGQRLSYYCGLKTMFFEYRLAPEHPYPAAIQDAVRAWDYLMLKGYGAKDIIVAGDSAGGNMALSLCLFLREQERMLPGGLVLMSPWTDMTAESESYKTYEEVDPILTGNYVRSVREAYCGKETDYRDVHFSPLFADFKGFPPTYIQVGQSEILLDDSLKLCEKMREGGASVKLDVYESGWHVFQQLPLPRSNDAVKDICEWLKTLI
ncbi:MAG: alpha/beta hydrolase [Eubacterium sp.]|nr:alpha/beta hydrolase [Eubacterium sp.]